MTKHLKHPHKESKKHAADDSVLLTGLPFEDQIWLFWRNYNRHVILIIALLVLGFIGYQGISFYKTTQIKKLQNEYQTALDQGKEHVFAENNIKEPLAGTVFLAAADQFVKDSKYDEAILNYNKALVSLKSMPFGDRARFGIAYVKGMQGELGDSKDLFKELVNDNKVIGAIRAEAAYQMALINLSEKDYAKSKEFLDIISKIPNAGIWNQKAQLLRDSTAGLAQKG